MRRIRLIVLLILSLLTVIEIAYTYYSSQEVFNNNIPSSRISISYNSSGGNYLNNSLITNNNRITLPTPEKYGYNFAGYYSNNNYVNTNNIKIGDINNLYLTARWNPINYSISYNYNGGYANNPTSYNIDTETIILNNPTRQGYNFTGWSGSGSGTYVTIPKGSIGNRNYIANWRKYDANDYGGIYLVSTKDGATWSAALDGEYNVGTQNAHVGNWLITVYANSVYIYGTKKTTVNRTYCFYVYARNNHNQLLNSACQYVTKGNHSELTIGW